MNILILGNSQVGALKSGHDDIKEKLSSMIKLSFLAIPEVHFCHLSLNGDQLKIPLRLRDFISSNFDKIEKSLDLSTYDYIIIAAGLSPLSPHLLYSNRLSSIRLYSRSVLQASISTPPIWWSPILRTSQICFDIIDTLREKVIFVGNVLPGPEVPLIKLINAASDELQDIVQANSCSIRELVSKTSILGSSKIILPPKHALGINQISLKSEYFVNGVRFNGELSDNQWHANSSYGALMINTIVSNL